MHFPFRVTGTVTVERQDVASYETRYEGEVIENLARQIAEALNYRGEHTLEVRQTFTPNHYLGNDNAAQTIFRHGTEVYLAYFDQIRIQVNRETIANGDFSDVTTMMRNESHWIYPQGNQMHFVRIGDTSDVTSLTYPQGNLVNNGTYVVRKMIPAGTGRMLVLFYSGGSTPIFTDLQLYEYTDTQITAVAGTPTLNAGIINALVGNTYEDFTDSQIRSIDWDLDANIAWFMVTDAVHSGTTLPGTLFLGTNMENFTNGALTLAPDYDFFAGFSNHVTDFYARIVDGDLNRIQILSDTGISTLYEDVGSPQIFVENINSGDSLDNQVILSDGATNAEWGFTGACVAFSVTGTDLECTKDDSSSIVIPLPGLVSDDTLTGDGTTASPLGVNEHDLITLLTEDIRYYTDPPYQISDRGATVGHRFNTSAHRKVIYRVGFRIDPPGGNEDYRARIFAIDNGNEITEVLGNSNTRRITGSTQVFNFDFPDGGVTLVGGQRIAIVASRTNDGNGARADFVWGNEADNSPAESYDDASEDFANLGFVEYNNANPVVGDSPAGTGTSIHGNPHIYYRVIRDKGSIVGDLDIGSLPNLASGAIADHDNLIVGDTSESNEIKRTTIGELAARLADGTTITSNAGTLTAVGGGGTADGVVTGGSVTGTTLTLTRSIGGDVTITGLPTGGGGTFTINTLPNLPTAQIADRDVLAIEDNSNSWAQHHITVGELAARLADGTTITSAAGTLTAASPFQGTTFYTADIAPGDPVLMRDISLGVNHSLSLEHLYGQMFTIAALHQTAPANDDQIVIRDVSSNILRHVRWDQFNQGSGGGGTTVVANPAGTDGADLTRIAIGGTNYNIAGGSGGGDTVTELFSGTQQLTTNLQLLGTGIEAPTTGYVRVYLEGAGNREGAVGSATIPAARLLAAQKAVNATWNADDANQRTIPIGANRSVSVATNEDAGNNNILIAAQDTLGSGDFRIVVEHVVPGGGGGGGGTTVVANPGGTGTALTTIAIDGTTYSITGGGGTGGIRVEEGNAERIASADALDFNSDDFNVGIIQTPEADISIAPAITRDTEIQDSVTGGSITDRTITLTRRSATNPIDITLPAADFDLWNDVSDLNATLNANDRILTAAFDVAGNPNQYTTVSGLYNGMRDAIATGTVLSGNDTFVFFDENVFGDPPRRFSIEDMFTTFNGVEVQHENTQQNARATIFDFTGDFTVTPSVNEAVIGISQNLARLDDLPDEEQVDDWVDNLLVAGANITLSYNDVANTLTITGQAGGGGTTVVANPGYNEANVDLGSLTIGGSDYNIRHPHRGDYDNAVDYLAGDIIETGTGVNTQFWIARENIGPGQGEPNEGVHGLWWHVAGFDGNFRGTLEANTEYDVFPGDYWIYNSEFYIAIGALTGRMGSELTRTGSDQVDQLVHSLRVQDEAGDLTFDVQELNFTGAGVTCTEPNTDIVTCNIPGGAGPFDLHDDVTTENATVDGNDRLLTSAEDVANDPNQYVTVTGLLNDFNELAPSNSIDTDDYIFFTNVSNTDTPLHKISASDFMDSFPRLITAPLFAAPATADEFIVFDVSDSNAVKRLSVANLMTTVAFDFRDDVTTQLSTLVQNDRILVTDESVTGDPMRYMPALSFFNSMRDVLTTSNSAPADNDRIFTTDESSAGDPVEETTVSELREVMTEDWAQPGNTDDIPASKLTNAGGGWSPTLHDSGNVMLSAANAFCNSQANCGDIDIPTTGTWGMVTFGTTEDGGMSSPLIISLVALRALTATAYTTTTLSDTTAIGMSTADISSGNTLAVRSYALGRTSGNKLRVASSFQGADPMPLSLYILE